MPPPLRLRKGAGRLWTPSPKQPEPLYIKSQWNCTQCGSLLHFHAKKRPSSRALRFHVTYFRRQESMPVKSRVSPEDLAGLIFELNCGELSLEEKFSLFTHSGWRQKDGIFEQLARSQFKNKIYVEKMQKRYYNVLKNHKEEVKAYLDAIDMNLANN